MKRRRLLDCIELADEKTLSPGFATDPLFKILVGTWWWVRGIPDDQLPEPPTPSSDD